MYILLLFLTLVFVYLNVKKDIENFSSSSHIDQHKFLVKFAKTPAAIKRGLMFRKEKLGANKGMLFDYGKYIKTKFWMKNTYIPLDILFLDHNYYVIDIYRNAIPLSEKSIGTDKLFRYAIEIDAKVHENIKIGDKIKL